MKFTIRTILKIRWIQNSLLVLCSSLFTFVIIDLAAFYLFDLKYPGYKGYAFYQFNPITGYIPTPNYSGYWYTYRGEPGIYISINSFGFTDIEHPVEKTKPRIALVGDSVLQAWEIQDGYRPNQLLQDKFSHLYDVLSFGIRGYGLHQSYLYFQNAGIQFDPDIVVINFCINDIGDNRKTYQRPYYVVDEHSESNLRLENYPVVQINPHNESTAQNNTGNLSLYLYNRSIAYRTINDFVKGKIINRIHRKLYGVTEQKITPIEDMADLRPYKINYNDEDQKRLDITLHTLLIFKQYLQQHSIKMLLVEGLDRQLHSESWRHTYELRYGTTFDRFKVNQILSQFSFENNIEFVSLQTELEIQQLNIDDFMYRSDSFHLNEKGSEFFSRVVSEKLTSLGWIESKNSKGE